MKFNCLSVIVLLVLFSCKTYKYEKRLKKIPTNVKIENYDLKFTVNVSTKHLPGTGKSRISSRIQLVDKNLNDLNDRFKIIKQTVINSNKIWESECLPLKTRKPYKIIGISKNGPYWEANQLVSVICYFKDNVTNTEYQLKVENQKIWF